MNHAPPGAEPLTFSLRYVGPRCGPLGINLEAKLIIPAAWPDSIARQIRFASVNTVNKVAGLLQEACGSGNPASPSSTSLPTPRLASRASQRLDFRVPIHGRARHPSDSSMRDLHSGLLALALILAALAGHAQLPAPRITWIFPAGAALGSTQEVTVAGTDLDEPRGLVFSDPRITAPPREDGSPVFRVTVPPDTMPGLVDVRVQGRFGVSNPRGFVIGTEHDLVAPATNTAPETAFDVPLDTAVHGRVQPATSSWFRFQAHRGQRLLLVVQARELDSRLVPDLVVLRDDNRHELRVARRSQVLDFTAPDDGRYLVQIRDQTYKGGDDYTFRLTVSTRRRVEFALPFALGPDFPTRVTLFGRNLPGGQPSPIAGADGQELEAIEVEITSAEISSSTVPLSAWVWRKPAGGNGAAEQWIASPRLGDTTLPPLVFAQTVLSSTWSISNGVTRVTPPCEFGGAFPRRGEISGVTFEAKKDSVFWIEVFSDRLGFNTDPHLVVQRVTKTEKGEEKTQDLLELSDIDTNLGGRDFDTTSRDAVGRFQVPEDGTFRVLVRDLYRGSSNSPRLPYRLQIRPETPDYRLAIFAQPPPRKDDNDRQIHLGSPALRRGGTVAVRVIAFRRDGFDGPIDISAIGLPPGVSASPARIASGQSASTLLLTASTHAPAGPGSVTVSGRARIRDQDVQRDAVASSLRWHIPDWDQERGNPRFTTALGFGVVAGESESAPIALSASDPKAIEVLVKGKLRIPLVIARGGEFQGAFKLKPFGHPALEKAKETDVPEKATNVIVEIDLGEAPLPEGEHLVHVEATVPGKYRNNPEAAEAATVTAKAADSQATEAAARTKDCEGKLATARKSEDAAAADLKASQEKAATGTEAAVIEARSKAEKRLEEARAFRTSTERALAEAQTVAKTAADRQTSTAAQSKAAEEKAKPKDVSVRIYSPPVVVRVTPPPKPG